MKIVTRFGLGLALALAGGALGYFAGAQDPVPAKPERTLKVNEIARVGNRVITAEELIQRLVEREKIYQDPDLRTIQWALDSLLLEEMLELEVDRLEATPKLREITAEYDALMKAWNEEFDAINKEIVKAQRRQGAEEKPYSREEWLLMRYDMSVAEFEAYKKREAIHNLKLRMVLQYWLISTDHADAQGLKLRSLSDIEKVRERLLKGEKLIQIARELSEDMYTRDSGGDVGTVYQNDGTFAPEVETAFWSLKDGEWSSPIKTDTGYWLVRKAKTYEGNEAEFFNQRETCIASPNPVPQQIIRWRHAIAAGGFMHFERRIPGLDVQAGEQ